MSSIAKPSSSSAGSFRSTRKFPGLKIVLEHLSSKIGVDYVRSAAPQVASTITPYHLQLNRTDWLGWGNRPYMYCMPVIKTEADRLALREAATSGDPAFFLGTDSAPHAVAKKLAVVGAAGLFNAPVAIETYAEVFEQEGRLDRLEAFASLNGPKHYGLPPNAETITLERAPWTAPEEIEVEGPEERALVYRGGETSPGGSPIAEASTLRHRFSKGSTRSLPPCGGGPGRGVALISPIVFVGRDFRSVRRDPHPSPPHKGEGEERRPSISLMQPTSEMICCMRRSPSLRAQSRAKGEATHAWSMPRRAGFLRPPRSPRGPRNDDAGGQADLS